MVPLQKGKRPFSLKTKPLKNGTPPIGYRMPVRTIIETGRPRNQAHTRTFYVSSFPSYFHQFFLYSVTAAVTQKSEITEPLGCTVCHSSLKGFPHSAKCLHNVHITMDPQNSNRLIYGMLPVNHNSVLVNHKSVCINMDYKLNLHNSVSIFTG